MKSNLVCPRCEKELDGHDEKACQRRMSRRYFFALGAGALAAVVVAPAIMEAAAKKFPIPAGSWMSVDTVGTPGLYAVTLNLIDHSMKGAINSSLSIWQSMTEAEARELNKVSERLMDKCGVRLDVRKG